MRGRNCWLYPLALAWHDGAASRCALRAAVSLGGTLVLMSKFYAPYFFTNVDMTPRGELLHGHPIEALKDVVHKLMGRCRPLGRRSLRILPSTAADIICCSFCCSALCWPVWHGMPAAAPCVLEGLRRCDLGHRFLALMLMYRPGEGPRHTLILDLLLLASLLCWRTAALPQPRPRCRCCWR